MHTYLRMVDILQRIKQHRFIKRINHWLKRVTLPGFRRKSLHEVGNFFIKSLWDEDLNLRASSLAFNFFLALFPAIIFFFTLIAYIPIDFLHGEILEYFRYILPESVYLSVISTIEDILKNQHGSLLSLGFIFALYFASNSFASMMSAFNKYEHEEKKRGFIHTRLRGIWLTLLVSMIVILTIAVITYAQLLLNWVRDQHWIESSWISSLITLAQYFSIFLLIYFSISAMFYFGSSRSSHWRFFSPGSTLASVLSLITCWGFAFYVNNFNSYNKLYGSIGVILAFMVLIYFNSLVFLIGFELNSSIDRAEKEVK